MNFFSIYDDDAEEEAQPPTPPPPASPQPIITQLTPSTAQTPTSTLPPLDSVATLKASPTNPTPDPTPNLSPTDAMALDDPEEGEMLDSKVRKSSPTKYFVTCSPKKEKCQIQRKKDQRPRRRNWHC